LPLVLLHVQFSQPVARFKQFLLFLGAAAAAAAFFASILKPNEKCAKRLTVLSDSV
jgi:hypothetical protein